MLDNPLPHVDRITAFIQDRLPEASLYLVGSAARGEAVIRSEAGRTIFYSDYEFALVTKWSLPAPVKAAIHAEMEAIEAEQANPNPLFHIDLAYFQLWRLHQLPKNIFSYELKVNARLLYGKDVRSRFPEVDISRIDLLQVNEIILKRLWALAVLLPNTFLTSRPSEMSELVKGYALSRNALDLLTILLPHAGILAPSYKSRNAALKDRWPKLTFAPAFGPDFPAFMAQCFEARRTLRFPDTAVDVFAELLRYFEKLLTCLSGENDDFTGESGNIFPERPYSPRQWISQAVLSLQVLRQGQTGQALDWIRQPKKARMTLGLLHLNQALLSWVHGNPADADARLAASAGVLADLQRQPVKLGNDFHESFHRLRTGWAIFWNRYLRFADPAALNKDLHALHYRYD